jgi:hypothetical protein
MPQAGMSECETYQCQKNSSHTMITKTKTLKATLIPYPSQNAHLKRLQEISARINTGSSQARQNRYSRRFDSIAAKPIRGSTCTRPMMATASTASAPPGKRK